MAPAAPPQVHFDPLQPAHESTTAPASVLCCSDSGSISRCSFGAAPGASALVQRQHGISSMDVERALGVDVVAVTEGQEIVYIRRCC